MACVKYACTALIGTNKAGKLTPDEDGYYTLIVGALDFYNSAKKFYDYKTSCHVLDESSTFMRRVTGGNLYAEHNHPDYDPSMSVDDYILRIKWIEPDRVCAHISEVWGEWENKGPNGERCFVLYAKVKPDGVRGQLLKDALENVKQNVCFSLRSLIDDNWVGGVCVRTITELVTFDWVIEPGISIATKYANPGLESYDYAEFEFTEQNVRDAIAKSRQMKRLGLESHDYGSELEAVLERTQRRDEVKFNRPNFMNVL